MTATTTRRVTPAWVVLATLLFLPAGLVAAIVLTGCARDRYQNPRGYWAAFWITLVAGYAVIGLGLILLTNAFGQASASDQSAATRGVSSASTAPESTITMNPTAEPRRGTPEDVVQAIEQHETDALVKGDASQLDLYYAPAANIGSAEAVQKQEDLGYIQAHNLLDSRTIDIKSLASSPDGDTITSTNVVTIEYQGKKTVQTYVLTYQVFGDRWYYTGLHS